MIVIPNTDSGLYFLNLFWAAVQRQAMKADKPREQGTKKPENAENQRLN
jgi:hypothetical protein